MYFRCSKWPTACCLLIFSGIVFYFDVCNSKVLEKFLRVLDLFFFLLIAGSLKLNVKSKWCLLFWFEIIMSQEGKTGSYKRQRFLAL